MVMFPVSTAARPVNSYAAIERARRGIKTQKKENKRPDYKAQLAERDGVARAEDARKKRRAEGERRQKQVMDSIVREHHPGLGAADKGEEGGCWRDPTKFVRARQEGVLEV